MSIIEEFDKNTKTLYLTKPLKLGLQVGDLELIVTKILEDEGTDIEVTREVVINYINNHINHEEDYIYEMATEKAEELTNELFPELY